MNAQSSGKRLAIAGAEAIHQSFDSFHKRFKKITFRAAGRFRHRDWANAQRDAAERLALYRLRVRKIEGEIRRLLGESRKDHAVWTAMKTAYSGLIRSRDDWEIAETYFNSVTRRIFSTVGVDSQIEFVNSDFDAPPPSSVMSEYRSYLPMHETTDTTALFIRVFSDSDVGEHIHSPDRWAAAVAARVQQRLESSRASNTVQRIDMACSIFYRGKGAYLLGRIMTTQGVLPIAVALHHPEGGVVIDAVLLDEDSLSILFSFTRSYFLVRTDQPYGLVRFLKSLMPDKRLAELYNSIGYNKHGKTELYRDILRFTRECGTEQFTLSPGKHGMVMIVFNMAHDDLVIKLIRDRFRSPKTTTRREVMDKYEMVFRHDRAGRLVEAHPFEHLKFDRCWFSDELLDELRRDAIESVVMDEDHIAIALAYVERRVQPLDLYLAEASSEEAREAVIDFGQAIKDLAYSNLFPGDMLLKNFGVTRHGRVVFYDYDELCPLSDCVFRNVPPPRHEEDELADEPWYLVGPNDVFPEEMVRFLGLGPDHLRSFLAHHADLFEVEFWHTAQKAIAEGKIIHILPYQPQERLSFPESH